MQEKVSVIVLSYNSANYIIETLESIINQSYSNIELIISDDCSTDNTIEVSKEYMRQSGFNNYKIIKTEKNSGTPANCNLAIKTSTSNYIKLIAADDLLLKDCIKNNVEFMKKNNNLIQFSKVKDFMDKDGERVFLKRNYKINNKFNERSVKSHLKELLFHNYISAPTVFFNKKIFDNYGLFDEEYKFIEDYPMWIKLLKNDVRINFIDQETILYRVHFLSLTNSQDKVINERLLPDLNLLYKKEIKPYLKKNNNYLYLFHKEIENIVNNIILKVGNKKGIKEKIIKMIFFIDPLWIKYKIKNLIS
ncbi:Chondroitin polymerase [uncultured Clostridium sp.]|uniref:glycosyltransferase n=1 Tax=uncultured Clostridium sp. TaxID=59620 RepID=UPI00082198E1|nr:glycosyltransferase [uncultured Clostridium sp.]SCJ41253.1 Chondroitin polymerase [uncultured Clostridium sp.]